MPDLGRRRFLIATGALATAPGAHLPRGIAAQPGSDVFAWGVGSFDPTPGSVILWTRVEPPADAGATKLAWVVASDESLDAVVAEGHVDASAEQGGCASVMVGGLAPGTVWWYGFTAPDGSRSRVGRTRTMPAGAGRGLRVAAASCSRFAAGGFGAYRALAEREVDVVVHLGDYVYEDGGSEGREHEPPHELVTLDDYRARHAQHRLDPDLQELHARHPMVATWDDHDIAGNCWRGGSPSHDEASEGPWEARVEAATRVHSEWLPGRTERAADGRLRAWRSIPLGGLAELVVLDTRLWGRDQQARTADDITREAPRSLLGEDQMAFVAERLAAPDRAPWLLIANQVMLHPLRVPVPTEALAERVRDAGFLVVDGKAINPDQWDGYPAAREQLNVAMGGRGGVVVLTGDVHSSWAWEGPANDGGDPASIEVVTPSISSEPFAERLPIPAAAAEAALLSLDDDLSFVEIQSHGYLIADLDAERVQAEWWYVDPADPASQRFGAARTAPITVPMHLSQADVPIEDPTPPSTAAGTTTTGAPVLEEPTEESDLPLAAVGGGAVAIVVGGVAAAVALRRRRER